MKRRYCIFAAQYFPHLGGVERYTYNLAKKLIEAGDEVTVVTSNGQRIASYEKMEGITVYRMPCINLLDGRYPVLKFNGDFRKIHHILREKNFDFVIVNTRFYIHSLYGQWFAWSKKIPVITIDHGSSHLSVNNKMWDAIGGVYEHMITKVGQLFCKDYYGVSKACVEWLWHFHIKAKGVLYNSVDLEEIERLLTAGERTYRSRFQIPEDATVITFTGRLLPEKGIPQLLDAMDILAKENPNLYLWVAGDGDLEELVNARQNEHVIPLGRLPFEEIITMLSESDIFCLPSFSEGFSTSILEAIACRCYVVTTKRGGAKETFPTDDYGMVIEDNETTRLTDALRRAVSMGEARDAAVELSYERLKAHYTWDIVSAQVRQLCQEKTTGKPRKNS